MKKNKTTPKKVLPTEPLNFYLSTTLLKKTWSAILVSEDQILARFNNQQVVRPIEAKAYAILATIYWLIDQQISQVTLWTDNYDCWRRFIKFRQRPVSTGYQLEREFYYSRRGKIAWPAYLWKARQLIHQHQLDLTLDYLPNNPATLLSQSLKVCAKCQKLKKIEPKKRNCFACWKESRQISYQRWKEWQESAQAPLNIKHDQTP